MDPRFQNMDWLQTLGEKSVNRLLRDLSSFAFISPRPSQPASDTMASNKDMRRPDLSEFPSSELARDERMGEEKPG